MSTVLENIASHQQGIASKALDEFRALARATEAGEDVDPAGAVGILEAAGKCQADLATAVELLQKRRGFAEQAAKLGETQAEWDALEAEILAANEKLLAAKMEHRKALEDLIGRQAPLEAQMLRSTNAREELLRTADSPEILAAERELDAKSRKLLSARKTIEAALEPRIKHHAGLARKLRDAKASATNWLKVPGFSARPSQVVKSLAAAVVEYEQTIKPLRDQLSALTLQDQQSVKESKKLNEQKMRP